jgi:hypothetical protein
VFDAGILLEERNLVVEYRVMILRGQTLTEHV